MLQKAAKNVAIVDVAGVHATAGLMPHTRRQKTTVCWDTGWVYSGARLEAKSDIPSESLPVVYLARHGETAWSLSGQHTGLTDMPLTERGRRNAVRLGQRLKGMTFSKVLTSPLQRATLTCQLAGFGDLAEVDRDLLEWNYGQYEGRTRAEILADRPEWQLFRDGCPGGESPEQVATRADRVVSRIRAIQGDVLLFSSGHLLRTLAARWLALDPGGGRYLLLSTASLSMLTYEHDLSRPAIGLWNDTQLVGPHQEHSTEK